MPASSSSATCCARSRATSTSRWQPGTRASAASASAASLRRRSSSSTTCSRSRRRSDAARVALVSRSEEDMRAVTVGELEQLGGPVELAEYDAEWPRLYERDADRIRATLGERV